jgi:hypothetical protein
MLAIRWGALEKLGLREPVAERVFALPPDREATGQLRSALEQAGMNTRGADIYVLPMADGGKAAILSLDASAGFDPERLFSGQGDWSALERLAEEGGLADLGVTRVAFDYANGDGESIVTLTTSTEALRRLDQDQMDDEEFIKAVKGRIDIPGLIQEVGQ